LLDDILARISGLDPKARAELEKTALEATRGMRFIPNPGPQFDALQCDADELFFGGAAGGGKSLLLCGVAVDHHEKSIIFRREYPQIKGLVDEVAGLIGTREGYNAQDKFWRLPTGNTLEFGSVPHEDDKERYQGRAHDFVGFDEITHFTESQYRFLIGWTRSATGKKCRVIAAGNPPFSAEGQWVIKYWAPWLDPTYPKPAKDGELRWFAVVDGKDIEVDGPGPHTINGERYLAKSRSFIKATLKDNPALARTGYAATLEGMQEPFRTMMLTGRFDLGLQDADYQVIPTDWIIQAQARWKPDGFRGLMMTAMALDIGAGRDETVAASRFGGWYAPLEAVTGESARDPAHAGALVLKHRKDNCPVVVDVGGGFGGASMLLFKENGIAYRAFNGAGASTAKTRDGRLSFVNKRAEAWWKFREELDPNQQGGSGIALPPDPQLRADLAAPTWELTTRGIKIESKDDIKARIGRSPDRGDACVMALSEGDAAVRKAILGRQSGKLQATANMGRPAMRRR